MKQVGFRSLDVAGAKEELLNLIKRNLNNNIIIYFDGWKGLGAVTVLRSIAQELASMKAPPPELCFGRIIYIDCSKWANKRTMQKKIAQELRLDQKTMAIFDEQDEEDDFNGLGRGSRDVIRSVAAVIDRTLRKSRFMMIFIYGSHDEVVLSSFGVPENSDCVIVWTFSTRVVTMGCSLNYESPMKTANKLRSTDVVHYSHLLPIIFSSSEFIALFREEAANIVARHPTYMWGIDLTTVVDCCLYGLLLYHNFRSTTRFVWPTHAPNYWICDGIIKGDRAWEISNALQPEIRFECNAFELKVMFKMLKEDLKTHFLVVKDDDDVYEKRPYRWISTTLRNKEINDDMQIILARASSIFLAFETKDSPRGLPNDFFKQCNKLCVLVLTCCAFSFVSPPFLHCHTLRFLGLDHCTDDNNPIELGGGGTTGTEWDFLKSLWVIDLYYTDWSEILSEEKINLMDNLMEANIEGVRWPWWTSQQLQKRLTYLRRLRIIRPMYDEAAEIASSDIADSSFTMDNTSLEILDLSGCSKGTGRNLPIIISKASHLQVLILDGCRGLEHIVISNNPSLRSFSFDGYGPASHRTSTAELPPEISRPKHRLDADKKGGLETSVVSLKGCTQVDNLFLRGLRNLEELDLSGCAIKVLDFGSMVKDVPWLERLFLVGCEHLRAIIWGSEPLELICMDTRPWSSRALGFARPPSLGAWQEYFRLRVHAIAADARLARSLWDPIHRADSSGRAFYFNISITSSDACSGVVQSEATASKEMVIGSSDIQRHYCAVDAVGPYDDVFTKVVGDGGLAPMQTFPQAPTEQLDRHVEIGPGSLNVQSEVELYRSGNNLAGLMWRYAQSVHIHDVSAYTNTMPAAHWSSLVWCRVERCPNLLAVFPPESEDIDGNLRTIWASDLLKARCIWSKGVNGGIFGYHFKRLRHLHLRRCPSLQFALAMGSHPSFPWLETLHIVHCGNLRHVFVAGNEEHRHPSVWFPKLTTIHLHDVPALREIYEAAEMLAPKLETIRIRGCWSLRRLPALEGREPGVSKPTVEIEKDVWDAMQWTGMGAAHHPSLYKAPVHSKHYKRRMLRRSVLR